MDDIKKKILTNLMDSHGALELFNMIHESSSSSESSEDEDDQDSQLMQRIDEYSEEDFKSQFRLNRSTVDFIVSNFAKSRYSTNSTPHGGRPRMECKKEIYVFLFYLGNTVTFKELGDIFGIQKSSAWFAVGRVSGWLVSIGDKYIKWPQREEVKENARKIVSLKKMPGVLGVINCTRVKTQCTTRDLFFPKKRKKNVDIFFQAVVDADRKFIDIDLSCADGKSKFQHSSRALRRSTLYRNAQDNYKGLFPYNTFLIGNSWCPNLNWLIPPFSNKMSTTECHIKFNRIHLSTQKIASDALGMLQKRFRRITKFTEQRLVKGAISIVASACILHNMCIIMNDSFEIDEVELESSSESQCAPEEEYPQNLDLEIDRRQLLFEYMSLRNKI
ncbi:putative nuclease HARBI1 [Eupeodes corollae]|uniref:putative nuclease HARBI1 n=1 Tax=Eupeodes corollae TaxID=290404 RepID=UPI0024906917|nr:putative nuclease HARBI1 [Eupeodes corollae]